MVIHHSNVIIRLFLCINDHDQFYLKVADEGHEAMLIFKGIYSLEEYLKTLTCSDWFS